MLYLGMSDYIMKNAIRHKLRCWNYLNLGMYKHACGSFRKFHREFTKSKKIWIE